MSAAVIVGCAFLVGLAGGTAVAYRRGSQRVDAAKRDLLADQFRRGYVHGWTEGRVAAEGERLAKAQHPTGSPESFMRTVDLEADRRMRELD